MADRFEPRPSPPVTRFSSTLSHEAVAAFEHPDEARPHQGVGGCPGHVLSVIDDAARRHLPALGRQEVRDRLEDGGLAGAVGAHEGDDLARRDGEVDSREGADGAAIAGLQRLDA